MAIDAITGFLEGVTTGFERGTGLRRQRTFDQQQAEEIQRKQIAEQIEAGRQAVLDQQNAARAAREAAEFQIETGLAPGAEPAAGPTGVAPPGLPNVPQELMDLRAGVAQEIAPAGAQAPAGFRRIGPSADEREAERVRGLRENVARRMGISPEDVEALDEFDLLDDLLREAGRPDVTSPLQRFEGQAGRMFTFDPRGEPGARVEPLMFEGEQLSGRRPADTFARSNAQAAMNAISRLDPFDFAEGEIEQERERVAQRFGFDSSAQAQQVLSEAIGGDGDAVDVEARATELRAQGLSDDEVIERLRAEGLISG